jgi:hypothetical protein
MNDSEFIELLNLYLDHEISAADAAKLEAEVQNHPARRRVYQQYCRMQKACRMVSADFETETETATATEKKVVPFAPVTSTARAHGQRMGNLYTIGTFAAVAACVAIVFVGRNQQRANGERAALEAQSLAQATPVAPKPELPAAIPASTPAPRGLVAVTPRTRNGLVADPLLLTGNTQAEAMRAAAVQQANNQLKWIEAVQLAPLQQRMAGEFKFDASLQSEGRPLGSRPTPSRGQETADEMVTFRFVK